MSEVDLVELRKNHTRVAHRVDGACGYCGEHWPCDAIRAAAELERLRKLMSECPECRLQAKVDKLVPNPDGKTIDELGGVVAFLDMRGVAPDATGDEMSEDFIRRKRDECDKKGQ